MIYFVINKKGLMNRDKVMLAKMKRWAEVPSIVIPTIVNMGVANIKRAYGEVGLRRRTGTAWKSIDGDTRQTRRGMIGVVGSNVEYVPYLNDGTKHMKGRKFFELGINKTLPQIRVLINRELNK